jgi:hypothetical protein
MIYKRSVVQRTMEAFIRNLDKCYSRQEKAPVSTRYSRGPLQRQTSYIYLPNHLDFEGKDEIFEGVFFLTEKSSR